MENTIPNIERLLKSSKILLDAYLKYTPSSIKEDYYIGEHEVGSSMMFNEDYESLENDFVNYRDQSSWYLERNIYLPEFSDCMRVYGEGFSYGYNNFENEIVVAGVDIINSETVTIQAIFDFVNNELHKQSISITINGEYDNNGLDHMREHGINRGYLYRAWIIILNRPNVYNSLFNKSTEKISTKKPKITFCTYLNHQDKESFAKILKNEFVNDLQGNRNNINTALFTFGLIENNCLNPGSTTRTTFHKFLKEFFDVNIGTSQNFSSYFNVEWKLKTKNRPFSENEKEDYVKRVEKCISYRNNTSTKT